MVEAVLRVEAVVRAERAGLPLRRVRASAERRRAPIAARENREDAFTDLKFLAGNSA